MFLLGAAFVGTLAVPTAAACDEAAFMCTATLEECTHNGPTGACREGLAWAATHVTEFLCEASLCI